jgi:tRNA nucleotidyltransferase (CCA-adding enzyme)
VQIYLVGGAVRDQLLGLPVKDRDWVVVGATPEEMINQGFRPVGSDFPVFLHPKTQEEYALARTERKSGRGYKGFTFHTSPDVTLEEDLIRRDLTINAMAMDDQGNITDPFNGQQDIKNCLLRHVSDAFLEDPLRVLRVARFLARFAQLGFSIAPKTLELMRKIASDGELDHLTPERVWQEFERALAAPTSSAFWEALDASNALYLLQGLGRIPSEQLITLDYAELQTSQEKFALACYLAELNIDELDNLCESLRIPNRYRDLAKAQLRHGVTVQTFSSANPKAKLDLISELKLIKQPEAIEPLIDIARALCPSEVITAESIQQATLEVAKIQAKDLIAEGFSGVELGREIQTRQLLLLE